MSNKAWSVLFVLAFLGGGLMGTACGGSAASPGNEVDAGTQPDGPSACSVPAPTTCPDPAPRYADVAPIIERRCVTCHAGTPGGPWSLAHYSHVADWQDTVRSSLRDCSMPPPDAGVPMPLEERVMILTWIRCGVPR